MSNLDLPNRTLVQINVGEYRRNNQKWTIQRNWQHLDISLLRLGLLCPTSTSLSTIFPSYRDNQFYWCRKTIVARLPGKNQLPATTLLIKLYTHIMLYRALISTCENRSRKFRCDRKPNYHKITSTADHIQIKI